MMVCGPCSVPCYHLVGQVGEIFQCLIFRSCLRKQIVSSRSAELRVLSQLRNHLRPGREVLNKAATGWCPCCSKTWENLSLSQDTATCLVYQHTDDVPEGVIPSRLGEHARALHASSPSRSSPGRT